MTTIDPNPPSMSSDNFPVRPTAIAQLLGKFWNDRVHGVLYQVESDGAGGYQWVVAAESSSGVSGSGSFVYRQGAVNPIAPVFNTFSGAFAAAKASGAVAMLYFDGSLGQCVIPSGTWDWSNVLPLGAPNATQTDVDVQDGAIFSNFPGSSGVLFNSLATTVSPLTVTSGTGTTYIFDSFGGLSSASTATLPFLHVSGAGTIVTLFLNSADIIANGAQRVVLCDVGASVLYNGDGSTFVSNNSLTGAGANEYFFVGLSTTVGTQAGAGNFSTAFSTGAPALGFTPAIPANWLVPPTQVSQALDELAAAGKLFFFDITMTGGTKTIASGKDLTHAQLISIRLKTQNTAVGSPVGSFVAGPNGNVTVTTYTAAAAQANTDASTYTCVFMGAV